MSEASSTQEPAIAPGRWRHRGGALYDVLGESEGGVIYCPAEDRMSRYWRSLPDFLASFEKAKEESACR